MQPRHSYRSAASMSWTRVEMLLVIYDRAISAIASGIQCLRDGSPEDLSLHRLQAQKAVLVLAEGLDVSQGQVPQRIMQLCAFVIQQTNGADLRQWESAESLLTTLRTAYEEIREEANRLEHEGQLPTLSS